MAQSWSNDQRLHSDDTPDMLLTLGASNSRDGNTARVYALRYPGRRQPDANMFQWLQECLRGIWSVEHLRHLWLQLAHGLHGHQPVKIADLHSIIVLSTNVGTRCASAAAFELVSLGTLSWGPCMLPDRLTARRYVRISFLEKYSTGHSWRCVCLWDRICGFNTMELRHTTGKFFVSS